LEVENYGMPPMQYYAVLTLLLTITTFLVNSGFSSEDTSGRPADGLAAVRSDCSGVDPCILLFMLAGYFACSVDWLCIWINHVVSIAVVLRGNSALHEQILCVLAPVINVLLFMASTVVFYALSRRFLERISIRAPRGSS
jgi:hypothetical protein